MVKPTLLLPTPLQTWIASILGLSALALAACGGPASLASSTVPATAHVVKPSTSGTATPIPFKFTTVDDPNSQTNAVMGINQRSKIVGTYGGGSGSTTPESYAANVPYAKFRAENDKGAQGTVATSLTSNRIIGGYVIDPPGIGGTQAFVAVRGLWTILEDPNEGSGANAVTQIFGLNDSEYAVGSYVNSNGTTMPFQLDIPNGLYTDLTPPGALNAAATGINGKSNISGWVQTSNGVVAFYLQAGTYYEDSYPGASATYAMSLNWQDQLVGYYLDTSGMAHGFVLTFPTNGSGRQIWQSVDEPKAAYGTWITGINNHHDICGYYVDASGVQHGFVATP